MSEVDGRGTTVTADGVSVEKSYEFEQFPVSAVTLVVRSRREEPVTVRITDPLPAGVVGDDVGLHSEYGEEHATIGDDEVKIAFDLDTDGTETIVYGLRDIDPTELEGVPPDPRVNAAALSAETDETSEIVRDVIAGAEEESTSGEEVEPLDLADPTPVADDGGNRSGGESSEDRAEPTQPLAGHVAALAGEIRDGDVDEADLAVLREALGAGADGSTDARIRDLQNEVADFRAYTDALEAFLDENGTAQALLSDLEEDIERLDTTIEDLQTDVGALEGTIDAVDERLEEEIAPDLADLRDGGHGDDLDERLDDLEAAVEDLTAEMEDVLDVQERLQSVFGTDSGD